MRHKPGILHCYYLDQALTDDELQFVAQRWFLQRGVLVRGNVRVVDTDMLLRGLES